MIRANEEWEFLYNKLKTENKILKEYETYIFSYAHENLSVDTLGMHIAAGLVKEHRELKKENSKLREERDAYAESMRVALRNGIYPTKESVRKEIARILGPFLRGADEKV